MWNSYIDQVVTINDIYFVVFLMWVSPLVHDDIHLHNEYPVDEEVLESYVENMNIALRRLCPTLISNDFKGSS